MHKPPGVPFHATSDQPGLLQLIRGQQGQAHLPYEGPLWPVHRCGGRRCVFLGKGASPAI